MKYTSSDEQLSPEQVKQVMDVLDRINWRTTKETEGSAERRPPEFQRMFDEWLESEKRLREETRLRVAREELEASGLGKVLFDMWFKADLDSHAQSGETDPSEQQSV